MRFLFDTNKARLNLLKHWVFCAGFGKGEASLLEVDMTNMMHQGRLAAVNESYEAGNWVAIPNPFAVGGRELNLRLHKDVIAYFDNIGCDAGWPAERVMELYLRNIARAGLLLPLELTSFKSDM